MLLLLEGFDKFGGVNSNTAGVISLLTAGEWTAAAGTPTIAAPLSATGFSLALGGSSTLTKTLGGNFGRLIGGVRFSSTLANVSGIQFQDASTNQAGICINTAGTIAVRNGSYNLGTLLGTSTASIAANTTHYLEWDITFSNAGSYQLWLDGVSILGPTTGDTTATANNTASQIIFGTSSTVVLTIDDLYFFDSTGSRNNAPLLNSPRIETTFPTSDSSIQFAVGAAILGAATQRSSTSSPAANSLLLRRFTPTRACTLNSITVVPGATSGPIQWRPVVYADAGGSPGTLMSGGSTVTGATANTPVTLPLTTPQSLAAGTQYWLGFMLDISLSIQSADGDLAGYRAAATFSSGAPGTAPTMTGGQASFLVWGNITGTGVSYYEVGVNPPPGSPSYVFSATSGQADLYGFPALSTMPGTVHAVAVKGYLQKSDAGARTISLRMNSAGTDDGGSTTGQGVGTTFGWQRSHWETDPATGVAWLGSGLNAATSGVKIDS